MAKVFDPSVEESWHYGPLLEVYIRFSGRSIDQFPQEEIERIFAVLGVPGLYVESTGIGNESKRLRGWNTLEVSYGVWRVSDALTLGVKVGQDALTSDLMLLVPPSQMEETLGPDWTNVLRTCAADGIQFYNRIVSSMRRFHSQLPIQSGLISLEHWCHRIPRGGRGIYLRAPAAEAIDPNRCTIPEQENLLEPPILSLRSILIISVTDSDSEETNTRSCEAP